MNEVKGIVRAHGGYVSERVGEINAFFDDVTTAKKVAEILVGKGYEATQYGTNVQVFGRK
jgi:hypothetical protein